MKKNLKESKFKLQFSAWKVLLLAALLFAMATPTAKAQIAGENWEIVNYSNDLNWRCVTYGNGTYVAVTDQVVGGSQVMTSTDGITWVRRQTPGNGYWNSITYGNGLFVAVSYNGTGNRVMTSPDGITWTSRTSAADNQWMSVTYGNGLFVAVSYNGTGNRVMTSPDGINWTSSTSAADNQWQSITYGNGLFVAVSSGGSGNRVMTSPDGINWTSRASAANNQWQSITYGNGLFVAVSQTGTGNRVMTSPDGITWTSSTSAADNNWSSVTYGNGLFVAVSLSGSGNRVMTSPDGITWTNRTSAADNGWRSVTYGNGLFVAVSQSGTGNRVMTSPDGSTWTSRTYAADIQWQSITYGNGLFVAVSSTGTGNRVMTSPDGSTWTSRTSAADNQWLSVTYGNGLFVAVSQTGTGNRVMTSHDGITWTSSTSAADNAWKSVTYGNGLFVAVSNDGTGNRVMTSPDGITWTSRTSAADNQWMSVTYGNGLFVAVSQSGSGNRVMTSPDGITWTSSTSAADNVWRSVTYGNGLFVAVSSQPGVGNQVMTSPNGVTWTSRNSGLQSISFASVAYGNGSFVAVSNPGSGNSIMMVSSGIQCNVVLTPASQTSVACHGGSDGTAAVNEATGGTAPYTYNWTSGALTASGTASVTGLSTGTWTCTVTDANGCSAFQNFTITQPTALALFPASQTSISCHGGSDGAATVNAATGGTAPYSYNWTSGALTANGTTSVTGLSAGTWTCTATDANGCSASRNFTITQPAAIALPTASAQTVLQGATVANLVATGTNLKWYAAASGGTALASTTAIATGTYYVSQTESSCESESGRTAVAVTVIIPVTPPTMTGSGSATSDTCSGTGSISVNLATGATPYNLVNSDLSTLPVGATVGGQNWTPTFTAGNPHYIQLTPPSNDKRGFITFLETALKPVAFSANFNLYVGNGSGADGTSFSYGKINTSNNGFGEAGMIDNGLAIGFNDYANKIIIYYNKNEIQSYNVNGSLNNSGWKSVSIQVTTSGQLTLAYGGNTYCTNYQLPAAYVTDSKTNWQYGFAARCGGLNNLHAINDVVIKDLTPMQYSVDGTNYFTNNTFSSLIPGTYEVYARIGDAAYNSHGFNSTTHLGTSTITSVPVVVTLTPTSPSTCTTEGGTIAISNVTNNAGPYNLVNVSLTNQQLGGATIGGLGTSHSPSWGNGDLVLTPPNSNIAGYIAFATTVAQPNAFSANYDVFVGGGSGGDGTSFNYGVLNTAGTAGAAETGMVNSGLAIGFSDYSNTIKIFYNKTELQSYSANVNAGGYKSIAIAVTQDGKLTIVHGGVTICSNYQLPAAYATDSKSNWQYALAARNGGANNWHSVKNVVIKDNSIQYSINGVTYTENTSFTNVSPGTYNVRARISNGVHCAAVGSLGSVTIATAPGSVVITQQPSTTNQSVALNAAATSLSVTATGEGPVSYQWYRTTTANNSGGSSIANAFWDSYTPPTSAAGTLYYYCVVSNACSQVNSALSGSVTTYVVPPSISYTTPVTYTVDTSISPLTPTNTGGAVASAGNIVSTYAGINGTQGSIDGPAATATFKNVSSMVADAAGNVYIADQENMKIRKISTDGMVTTFAGGFSMPMGITIDAVGNLYVIDNFYIGGSIVRKITPAGVVTSLAGHQGSQGSQDGMGAAASIASATGITVDPTGNVFIGEPNKIRKITPAGLVSTIALTNVNGLAINNFTSSDLAIDSYGNLFSIPLYSNFIQKITPAGVVTTFAGSTSSGNANGIGTAASFSNPSRMVIDAQNTIFVTDLFNSLIRKITPSAVVSTYAGTTYSEGTSGNINGPAAAATFTFPKGIALDPAGNLFVGQANSNTIRKIAASGGYAISPSLPAGLSMDATTGVISGTPTVASAATDYVVTAINAGGNNSFTINMTVNNVQAPNISYTTPVTYTLNTPIAPLTPTNTGGAVASAGNVVSTYAGSVGTSGTTDGPAATATFNSTHAMVADAAGNVYVGNMTSSIRKISTDGMVTTFATGFSLIKDITIDAVGNLYVIEASFGSGSSIIKKITPAGVVTTLAGHENFSNSSIDGMGAIASFSTTNGIAVDLAGNVYVAEQNKIRKITPAGLVSTIALTDINGAAVNNFVSRDLVIDSDGNLFSASLHYHFIQKITPAGVVTTFAGYTSRGSANGIGTAASFNSPTRMAIDAQNTIFVTDMGNSLIRKITPSAVVSTYAGITGTLGTTNGIATEATFTTPDGIAVDAAGNVFVGEQNTKIIRKIAASGGYAISPSLPAGLSMDATTGIISGTPTVASAATDYVVTVSNAGGNSSFTINMTVNNVPAPTADAQTFCGSKTVADLVATGTNLQWYELATGGNALATTTVLATGNYYVSQTVNGSESDRTLVAVTVNNSVAGTVSNDQLVFIGTPPANITLTGSEGTVQWQSSLNNSTFADLADATGTTLTGIQMGALTTKRYYRAVVTSGSCASVTSSVVTVAVVAATKVQVSQCGAILAALNTAIIANSVVGVSNYRFKVVNGATTETIETVDRWFRLTALSAGVLYNTTYTISVATKLNGAWSDFGDACAVNTPTLTSKVQASQCGTTLADLNSAIVANTVTGATHYRFKVVNGATTETNETASRWFYLKSLTGGALYNTAYTISVAIKLNGVWGAYGDACTVTTPGVPATKVQASQCGTTLADFNAAIVANSVTGVTQYRFKVVNGTSTQTIETGNRWFYLKSLTGGALFNTTYTVSVASKYNGVWGDYGDACTVSTLAPKTKVQASQCGQTLATLSTAIVANTVSAATNYRFKVVNGTTTRYAEMTNRWFRLTALTGGGLYNTAYTVSVAVKCNGVWGDYGDECSVTTPSAPLTRPADLTTATELVAFKVTGYPNPYTNTFKLELATQSNATVAVRVYDMMGKLIEVRNSGVAELGTMEIGDRYATGVYNVIVTQGTETKTIRMIKK